VEFLNCFINLLWFKKKIIIFRKGKTNTLYGLALVHKWSKNTATKKIRIGNKAQCSSKITGVTWILSNITPCSDPDSAEELLQLYPCTCLAICQDTTWGMSHILIFRELETVRTQYIIILPLILVCTVFRKLVYSLFVYTYFY